MEPQTTNELGGKKYEGGDEEEDDEWCNLLEEGASKHKNDRLLEVHVHCRCRTRSGRWTSVSSLWHANDTHYIGQVLRLLACNITRALIYMAT